jgi:hypothetical protein
VDTGNFAAILQNFALAPTTLADAFLNGVPSDSLFGLLSAQDGPIGALLGLAEDIAQAITPAASSAAAVDPGTMLTDITSVLNPSTVLSDLSSIFDGGSLSTFLDPANITAAYRPPTQPRRRLLKRVLNRESQQLRAPLPQGPYGSDARLSGHGGGGSRAGRLVMGIR